MLGSGGGGARPDDIERVFVADEKFGAAADVNGENIGGIELNVGEAFFFGLQSFVGTIESDAELMCARGQLALELDRGSFSIDMQRSSEKQLLIGEDSECALGDGGGDVDVQTGELDGGDRRSRCARGNICRGGRSVACRSFCRDAVGSGIVEGMV